MRADLHLHTTASDGKLTPRELVRQASELKLDVIAITDHDSVDGIQPALEEANNFPGIMVIPGVEISTDVPRGEVHVLGYFIDYKDISFNRTLEELRNSRFERGKKMVAKLADMGIKIDWDRVLELAGKGSVGRPHIAQAIVERGYVSSVREAFDNCIGRNCPAYVERKKLTLPRRLSWCSTLRGCPSLHTPQTSNIWTALSRN
jgi:predicted metal-dependent phosphoesterase TrpH